MDGGKEAGVIHIHEIYIKAPAAAIWEAITSPEWSARYGYRGIYDYDLRRGGKFRVKANAGMLKYGLPETIIDGEVLECSPPNKLVQTYRFLFDEQQPQEGFSKITFEIEDTGQGFCRLTVTHDVTEQPTMAAATASKFDRQGGGGWNWILSDLKSLLETGKTMGAAPVS
jgi:uncharacterized protein YndB with AHSA1/START domain